MMHTDQLSRARAHPIWQANGLLPMFCNWMTSKLFADVTIEDIEKEAQAVLWRSLLVICDRGKLVVVVDD
jgi:hypothetical protein